MEKDSSIYTIFPQETWLLILMYLPFRAIINMRFACKELRELSYDKGVWKNLDKEWIPTEKYHVLGHADYPSFGYENAYMHWLNFLDDLKKNTPLSANRGYIEVSRDGEHGYPIRDRVYLPAFIHISWQETYNTLVAGGRHNRDIGIRIRMILVKGMDLYNSYGRGTGFVENGRIWNIPIPDRNINNVASGYANRGACTHQPHLSKQSTIATKQHIRKQKKQNTPKQIKQKNKQIKPQKLQRKFIRKYF